MKHKIFNGQNIISFLLASERRPLIRCTDVQRIQMQIELVCVGHNLIIFLHCKSSSVVINCYRVRVAVREKEREREEKVGERAKTFLEF